MTFTYQQHINGAWTGAAGGGTWDVINPATEEVVRSVPFGGRDDCHAAIEAAARAFPDWARRTPYERGAILQRAAARMREVADEAAHAMVLECGKPLAQARGEWLVGADLFDWFAEEGKRAYGRTIPSRVATKRMTVLRQPLGVVGVITAWNFPAYNPARAWAAALAAGCTVVGRPSEFTPLTAMAMTQVLVEAGLPAGVLNLVNGDPEAMGQEMLDHPACRKISFTGSVRVGKILMDGASRTVTRLSLELGGNAPVIVLPDVDLEQVTAGAIASKFRNNGQVCVSPQRFLVHRRVADAFADGVSRRAAELRLGSGLDSAVQVGPLINARQRDRVAALVAGAAGQGVEIRSGGRVPAALPHGYFFEPTVLSGVAPDMLLFREEIFGPVMPIVSFDEVDEAIALANQTPYGLAAYVWTNDLRASVKISEALEFGMVGINEWAPHATEAPFGGWKQSGVGHESGSEGLAEYLETKLVAVGGLA
ncbi:MAG: NAD-dependent succinate-semialdehyde dehydrogenase [Acidobacteria bacterium]|nr:NAD-dependent succinate-semialdehyde dehydrogenase [Acidobacteriota bacterium]MSO83597.1 NAD-dependent succinate-semialdehyde dehydrogenase [Acidobacteriota bacterium]